MTTIPVRHAGDEAALGTADRPLRLDVHADVACPWCWIGEHRLAAALARLQAARERAGQPALVVERRWQPFQLQPDLPRPGLAWQAFAEAKFGGADNMAAMFAHVRDAGAADGLDFRFDRMAAAPNTADAHRLVLHARATAPAGDRGERELAVADALFCAYFHEGRHVGERAVLLDVADAAGLDRDAAARALDSTAHVDAVRDAQRDAARLGIRGVPFVVLDGRFGVSGAQPVDAFARAIEAALA